MTGAEDGADPERFRRLTGGLASCAAEGDQGVVPGVKAPLGGNAPHGLGGLFDGDSDKALGSGLDAVLPHGGGKVGQSRPGGGGVQGLIRLRAKNAGEEVRVQSAQNQIGVGDRRRPAPAIGRRPGIGTG